MRPILLVSLLAVGCGGHPAPPLPPIDSDAIRRACAMEASCLTPSPLGSASSCAWQFELGLATGVGIPFGPSESDIARYVSCTNSSASCGDALACASQNHGPDWCGAHPQPTCDGDLLVNCAGGWGLELQDCRALGLRCETSGNTAACSDGRACDPATATKRCDGNRLIQCNANGRELDADCASIAPGATCHTLTGSNGSTTAGCFLPGSSSCTTEGQSCDGSNALRCSQGRQTSTDCSKLAGHCAVSGVEADCVADATDCNDKSVDSCVGGALRSCSNGQWATTDCKSIGLTRCATVAGAARCQ